MDNKRDNVQGVINAFVLDSLKEQDRSQAWLSKQIGINEKTLSYKLRQDTLSAYELIKIAKVFNIDLNKFKEDF